MAEVFGISISTETLKKICSLAPVSLDTARDKTAAIIICLDAIVNGASGQENQSRRKDVLSKCGYTVPPNQCPTVWAFGVQCPAAQFKRICGELLESVRPSLECCKEISPIHMGAGDFWPACESNVAVYKEYRTKQEAKSRELRARREQAGGDGWGR
eukprot:GHVU01236065.1.p1 GENE.GHVU01236065.1~~GHVU01236065.1.p1  ORF type:complete len:157 (-),score=19.36 GHVU01236065.1:249-719(-)